MSVFYHDVTCPACGAEALMEHDTDIRLVTYYCTSTQCELHEEPWEEADHEPDKFEQFKERISQDDFAIGDTFWLDGFEFEVISVP